MPSQSVASGSRLGPRARSQPLRIAIDLETTGLNAESDAIIEIGAVKFSGHSVLDRLETLVAPTAPLPYRIQRLTGITPATLRRAPALHEVLARLGAFVGEAPLVGHNVGFDAAFLRRAGLFARNPLIDTYELASTLLPTLSSYSLSAVGDALGLHRDESHRALADADLARRVLLALLDRMAALETGTVEELCTLPQAAQSAHGRGWSPGFLLREELRSRQREAHRQLSPAGNAFAGSLTTNLGDQLASRLGVHPSVLALAGPVPLAAVTSDVATAPSLPSRERREAAGALAAHVTRVLQSGGALLVETEHDVEGLVASVAAALRATSTGEERLVIAVADPEALRRLSRDILPLARAALGDDGATVQVAEIAQRDAYLCLWRWYGAARATVGSNGHGSQSSPQTSAELTRGLAKLVVWTRATRSGMRADVALSGQEIQAWERVRAGREFADSAAACPYGKHGFCFLTAAQGGVSDVQVVATTHAALAASLAGTDDLLPAFDRALILDAHLFEDALRETRGLTVDRARLHDQLNVLAHVGPHGKAGLLHAAMDELQTLTRRPEAQRSAERVWFEQVSSAQRAVDALFEALRALVSRAGNESNAGASRGESGEQRVLRIDTGLRRSSAWRQAANAWRELASCLQDVVATSRHVAHTLTSAERNAPGSGSGIPLELLGVARQLEQLIVGVSKVFDDVNDDEERVVSWLRVPYANQFDRRGGPEGSSALRQPSGRHGGQPARPETLDAPSPGADVASEQTGVADVQTAGNDARSGSSQQPSLPTNTDDDTLRDELPVLHSAVVPVDDLVAPLVSGQRALVLASPSLAVGGDFEYIRGALKLPEASSVAALTLDRVEQTLLALPSDVPEPNAPRYQRVLEETLIRLATTLDGRLVALFPSHAALRSAYNGIRRALEAKNILVLGQGQDGSVRQLWHSFATEQRIVLLGAGSFWDGSMQRRHPPACVVVTKLPFPAMSDPLLAARSEQYDDPQHQFVVPQAALKLHQALSGLAWSHTERNAVVLFDRRVQTRSYGSSIVGSLPRCTQHEEPVDMLAERIAEWVGPA